MMKLQLNIEVSKEVFNGEASLFENLLSIESSMMHSHGKKLPPFINV